MSSTNLCDSYCIIEILLLRPLLPLRRRDASRLRKRERSATEINILGVQGGVVREKKA